MMWLEDGVQTSFYKWKIDKRKRRVIFLIVLNQNKIYLAISGEFFPKVVNIRLKWYSSLHHTWNDTT